MTLRLFNYFVIYLKFVIYQAETHGDFLALKCCLLLNVLKGHCLYWAQEQRSVCKLEKKLGRLYLWHCLFCLDGLNGLVGE